MRIGANICDSCDQSTITVGEPKPIKIFYPGTHTDSQGRTVPVSKSALSKLVSNFNGSGQRIPLVVGHPETNEESFGYATELAIDDAGTVAIAKYDQLSAAFKSIVNEVGSKISAKLRLPGHPANKSDGIELDHVGFFFGKQRVALDQLDTASFSRDEFTSYIKVQSMDDEDLKAKEAAFAAKQAEFEAKAQEAAAKEAEFAAKQAEFEAKQAEFAAKEAEFAAQAAIAPVVAELVAGGHVPPVDQPILATIFTKLEADAEFGASFAASDASKTKETPVKALARIMKTAKVPLGKESDPDDGDEDDDEDLATAHFMAPSDDLSKESQDMDAKIRKHMTKSGLNYSAARKAVMKMEEEAEA